MRSRFDEQLSLLNTKMIEMGNQCQQIITLSVKALLTANKEDALQAMNSGYKIDELEREIEGICLKLLLQQQPVAKDLRVISAALKMITDMERIGDQAEDIAEIISSFKGKSLGDCSDIRLMAESTIRMVNDSINAYVSRDLELAQAVCKYDDVIDDAFDRIKQALITMIASRPTEGEEAIDLLMIAKYFERIGDHAVNIAEWVEFSVTGNHPQN